MSHRFPDDAHRIVIIGYALKIMRANLIRLHRVISRHIAIEAEDDAWIASTGRRECSEQSVAHEYIFSRMKRASGINMLARFRSLEDICRDYLMFDFLLMKARWRHAAKESRSTFNSYLISFGWRLKITLSLTCSWHELNALILVNIAAV